MRQVKNPFSERPHEPAGMILVAIGANLPGPWGKPIESCREAVLAISRLPGIRLQAESRWYRSAPVPRSAQPDYVNGVVRLRGEPDPAGLLRQLQAIEQSAGRIRGARDAARTLDLDIIDMGGLVRASPDLVLPHPRASVRAFVLLPLQEVAPDWREPGTGRPVGGLLEQLRGGCEPSPSPLDWPIPF